MCSKRPSTLLPQEMTSCESLGNMCRKVKSSAVQLIRMRGIRKVGYCWAEESDPVQVACKRLVWYYLFEVRCFVHVCSSQFQKLTHNGAANKPVSSLSVNQVPLPSLKLPLLQPIFSKVSLQHRKIHGIAWAQPKIYLQSSKFPDFCILQFF